MSRCCNKTRFSEAGAILVIGPFALALVLLFAGIAIDGVRLYHTRYALQKLADTAAVGVIGYTVQDGTARVLRRFEVEEISSIESSDLNTLAREITAANAAFLGWAPNEYLVRATQLPRLNSEQVFSVRVEVERTLNFLLLDRIPLFQLGLDSMGNNRRLSAVAESTRKRANISVLLDTSRSMECPSFEPCTCKSPARVNNGPCPKPWKSDTLREATTEFARRFDLDSDRIHFVPFQLLALTYSVRELLLIAKANNFYDGPIPPERINGRLPEIVDAMLDALTRRHHPIGNSNFSDALYEAFKRMSLEVANPLESVAYVLVTDGAPTAATLNLANPLTLAESPAGSGARRYVSWTNDFYNSTGRASAPSALSARDSFAALPGDGMGYEQANPPPVDLLRCPGSSPVPAEPTSSAVQQAANQAFSCVSNLGFYLNKANGELVRDSAHQPIVFGRGERRDDPLFVDWKKQYFNAAVAQADSMRGTIFVVGIGEPAAIGTDCYQNADDSQSRHDVFLARLANDYYLGKQLQNHPECDFTGGKSYDSWRTSVNRKQGQFFPISPNENLRLRMQEVYRQIAVRVQLSLIR